MHTQPPDTHTMNHAHKHTIPQPFLGPTIPQPFLGPFLGNRLLVSLFQTAKETCISVVQTRLGSYYYDYYYNEAIALTL